MAEEQAQAETMTLDDIEASIGALEASIDSEGATEDNSAPEGDVADAAQAEKPLTLNDLATRIDGIEAENARLREDNARMANMLGRMVKYSGAHIGNAESAQGQEAFPKPMTVEKVFPDTAQTPSVTPLGDIVLGS